MSACLIFSLLAYFFNSALFGHVDRSFVAVLASSFDSNCPFVVDRISKYTHQNIKKKPNR